MAITIAIAAVVLLGLVSLGVEVTGLLMKHRQMQSAADAAAMAGAVALAASSPSGVSVEARAVAGQNGFVSGVNSVTVAVNAPPLSGTWAGNPGAVEVVISQPQILPLSALLYKGAWSVSGRGVASVGNSASDCVLSLNPAAALSITGGVTVNLKQCGLAANGTGAGALSLSGGVTLNAGSVTVSGTTSVNGGSNLNVTGAVKINQPATADPYAGVAVPTWSGCNHGAIGNPYTVGYQGSALTPGVYCGGLTLNGGGANTMAAGVYFINGGVLQVGNGASLSGTGVTIVLTGSGGNYATVAINGGSPVNLTAPTTGPTAGLVFFQDPNAPYGGTDTFSNGATVTITGALYFPKATASYGGGTKTSSPCSQLVAWQVQFSNGAWFNNNCANTGVVSIGAAPSKMVE